MALVWQPRGTLHAQPLAHASSHDPEGSDPLTDYVPTSQRGPIGGVATSSGSGSWTPDAAAATEHQRTVTGDTTVAGIVNGATGQPVMLWFYASGAQRTVTFAAGFETSQPVPGRVLTIPAGTWGSALVKMRGATPVLMAAYPQPAASSTAVATPTPAGHVAYSGSSTNWVGRGSGNQTAYDFTFTTPTAGKLRCDVALQFNVEGNAGYGGRAQTPNYNAWIALTNSSGTVQVTDSRVRTGHLVDNGYGLYGQDGCQVSRLFDEATYPAGTYRARIYIWSDNATSTPRVSLLWGELTWQVCS